MHPNDIAVEKSHEDVQVENVLEPDPISHDVKVHVEAEIFPGVNKQTILAFLVSLPAKVNEDSHRLMPC